jgi:hypothetical protein
MIIPILLIHLFSPIVFGFGFSTTGCVDEAGTASCFADVLSDVAGTCGTICGCSSPFHCTNANKDCLIGCGCVGYEKSINCILESCWNKVCLFVEYPVGSNKSVSRFTPASTRLYSSNRILGVPSQSPLAGPMSSQNATSPGPAPARSPIYGSPS